MKKKSANTGICTNSDAPELASDMRQSWRIEMGERIQAAAKRIGSQQKAADAAGVSLSTLQRYFRGEVDPSLEGVKRLAEEAAVSVGWLVSGEGEKWAAARETPVSGGLDRRQEQTEEAADGWPEGSRPTKKEVIDLIDGVVDTAVRVVQAAHREGLRVPPDSLSDVVKLAWTIPRTPENDELIRRLLRQLSRVSE